MWLVSWLLYIHMYFRIPLVPHVRFVTVLPICALITPHQATGSTQYIIPCSDVTPLWPSRGRPARPEEKAENGTECLNWWLAIFKLELPAARFLFSYPSNRISVAHPASYLMATCKPDST
jgi:hypothetical protein